jgi:hypothetical protein
VDTQIIDVVRIKYYKYRILDSTVVSLEIDIV